jgi:phosphoserine phosphatase
MRWPPYQHIFFDCDSTLTAVEGIDVLAEGKGKGWRVKVLTDAAMNGELELQEVYAKRLQAIQPTRAQVMAIRQVYKNNMVEDAAGVIATLQRLGHHVYIISGGLLEPVREFGLFLGVPERRIRAVGLEYDQLSGTWWAPELTGQGHAMRYRDYVDGALTISDGKARIIRELIGDQRGRSLLIGDGTSDLLAGEAVDLFVGFGGVSLRERVRDHAPVYIHSASLAPLLLLGAGPASVHRSQGATEQQLFGKARDLALSGAITFQDERLKKKFNAAYEAVHSRTD